MTVVDGRDKLVGSLALATAVFLLLALPCRPTDAIQELDAAARYLSAREELDAVTQVPPHALATQDASLCGLVLELRGELVLSTSFQQPATHQPAYYLLLRTDDGVTVGIDCPESIEDIAVGQRVAVLVTLPENSNGRGHFRLQQIIPESALPSQERRGTSDTHTSASSSQTRASEYQPSARDSTVVDTSVAKHQRPPQAGREGFYDPQRLKVWKTWIAEHNSQLSEVERDLIVSWTLYHSDQYGVDHRLIFSVILAESSFDPRCVSRAGAQGLMQLMPGTARALGVADPFDIAQNLRGGIEYLATYLRKYRDKSNYEQCALALACYNAGPSLVERYGGVPPIPETRRFINKITTMFHDLDKAGYP